MDEKRAFIERKLAGKSSVGYVLLAALVGMAGISSFTASTGASAEMWLTHFRVNN